MVGKVVLKGHLFIIRRCELELHHHVIIHAILTLIIPHITTHSSKTFHLGKVSYKSFVINITLIEYECCSWGHFALEAD